MKNTFLWATAKVAFAISLWCAACWVHEDWFGQPRNPARDMLAAAALAVILVVVNGIHTEEDEDD